MPLLRSLTRAGLTVWSPTERVTRRVPRANVKRKVDQALMPSYIFAAADDLDDITAIGETPVSPHRPFRVFYWHRKLPVIADAALAPLRLLEQHAKLRERRDGARGKRPAFGQRVTLTDGPFAGLDADVEKPGGTFTTVRIAGFNLPLKIANYHLLPNGEDSAKRAAA